MKTIIRFAVLAAVLSGTTTASAQTVEGLLGRIPESANFVAVVNNRAILQTPRATREGWSKLREFEYLSGAIPVPPSVPLVVMGSQIEAGDLTGKWAAAAFVMSQPQPMKTIAERNGGRVETMNGYPVAITPRFGYMVQLVDNVYGLMSGAGRQEFSRWVKSKGNSRKPAVNDYLKQVATDARDFHVSVAVDLDDLIDPAALHARLATLKSLVGRSNEEIAALEKLLAGAKGLRINLKVGDSARTYLRLDFKGDIGNLRDLLKPTMDELVGTLGIAIEEFDKADWSFESKAAVLAADLSDVSLARLMTLALMPMNAMDAAPVGSGAAEIQLIATRRYYRAIAALLDDLQKQNKKAVDYAKTAVWHETFAARIDQLPQASVDPDMLKYGYNVASKLRILGASLKGVPVKTTAALAGYNVQVAVVPTSRFRFGIIATDNSAEVLARQAQIIAKDEIERDKVWSQLDEDRRQIRKLMAEKFKTDFDAVK
jgi:hypothetical protein